MAKLAAVLDRLVREVTRLDPDFTLRPETPERMAAAERLMGEQLPDGYREFLEKIGRTRWPVVIGNLVDHRSPEVPTRFIPFGRRADHAFDVAVFVRRRPLNPSAEPSLRVDLVQSIATKRAALAGLEDEESIEEAKNAIFALEDELEDLDHKPLSRRGATKHLPVEWCERETGTLASAPHWKVDGPWDPEDGTTEEVISARPFAEWLDATITQALAPTVRPPAPSVDESTSRTRQLLELLVETGGIEVVEGFDEGAAALALSPLYGDSEEFHAALLDVPGVEEVFLSEDDLELRFDTDKH